MVGKIGDIAGSAVRFRGIRELVGGYGGGVGKALVGCGGLVQFIRRFWLNQGGVQLAGSESLFDLTKPPRLTNPPAPSISLNHPRFHKPFPVLVS